MGKGSIWLHNKQFLEPVSLPSHIRVQYIGILYRIQYCMYYYHYHNQRQHYNHHHHNQSHHHHQHNDHHHHHTITTTTMTATTSSHPCLTNALFTVITHRLIAIYDVTDKQGLGWPAVALLPYNYHHHHHYTKNTIITLHNTTTLTPPLH